MYILTTLWWLCICVCINVYIMCIYIYIHIKDCWKGEEAQSEECGVSHGGRALVGSAGGALVLVSGGLPGTEVW